MISPSTSPSWGYFSQPISPRSPRTSKVNMSPRTSRSVGTPKAILCGSIDEKYCSIVSIALATHPYHEQLVLHAYDAICNLSIDNDLNKYQLSKKEVCANILSSLDLHKANPKIIKQGMIAISDLAKLPANKIKFSEHDLSFWIFADVLEMYKGELDICSRTLNAVFCIVTNCDKAIECIVKSGVPAKLIGILDRYKEGNASHDSEPIYFTYTMDHTQHFIYVKMSN